MTVTAAEIKRAELAAQLRTLAEAEGNGVAELLSEAAAALEPKPKRKREKPTSDFLGAIRRQLRAVVGRIERDGDVTAWAELYRMRADLERAIDQGAAVLLRVPPEGEAPSPEGWAYPVSALAGELGVTKTTIYKQFRPFIQRKRGAQPGRLR